MKNITLAIDEKILDQVRAYAARQGTTVNELVRRHFQQIAGNEDRARQAMRELREMSERSTARVGKITWKRDDLYER
jgi:hypothetical protein